MGFWSFEKNLVQSRLDGLSAGGLKLGFDWLFPTNLRIESSFLKPTSSHLRDERFECRLKYRWCVSLADGVLEDEGRERTRIKSQKQKPIAGGSKDAQRCPDSKRFVES